MADPQQIPDIDGVWGFMRWVFMLAIYLCFFTLIILLTIALLSLLWHGVPFIFEETGELL